MNKLPFLLILFFIATTVNIKQVKSQEVQIGIIGGGSSTWIFNKHITKAPSEEQTYIPSFGVNAGFTAEYVISRTSAVWTGIFVGSHNQRYKGKELDYRSLVQWQKWSFPFVWKHKQRRGGGFIEGGFQFASVSEILYTYNATKQNESGPTRVLEDFKHNFLDLIVGVGKEQKIDLKKWIHLNGMYFIYGARLSYSLTDLRGVDAYGRDLTKKEVLQTYYEGQYKPTHSAALSAYLGIKYRIYRR